ncbi:unnamed protein product, partial [marine sediment metagenome]
QTAVYSQLLGKQSQLAEIAKQLQSPGGGPKSGEFAGIEEFLQKLGGEAMTAVDTIMKDLKPAFEQLGKADNELAALGKEVETVIKDGKNDIEEFEKYLEDLFKAPSADQAAEAQSQQQSTAVRPTPPSGQ